MSHSLPPETIRERIQELGSWFHNLDLGGVQTAPELRWLVFQSMLRGSAEVDVVAEDYPIAERSTFDSSGFPRMHFIEQSYSHDGTNWWIPNRACAEALLRSSGFEIRAHPEEEVYICRRRDL